MTPPARRSAREADAGRAAPSAPYHHGNLRAALLERAIERIERDGIEALSLRSLARELAVSHAAPARHFRTRADLLAAIALDGAERLIAAVSAALVALPEGGPSAPVARLRALSDAFLDWVLANPAHHRAMRHPEVVRHADEALLALLRGFSARIAETARTAQEAGWKADVPTTSIVFQIIATLDGAAAILTEPLYGAIDGRLQRRRAAEHALERLLAGD